MVDENMVHPFHFKRRVIFMSMYNDFDSCQRHNEDFCKKSPSRVSASAKSFPTVCLTYLGRGYEEKVERDQPSRANQNESGTALPKL